MTPLSIFVIDDSTTDLQMVERALLDAKIRCALTTALTGTEAIAKLKAESDTPAPPVDLLLLDLSLPDMDGLDVLDECRDYPPLKNTVIVALTGSRDPAIIHMARERGVHALMNKPLNVTHLVGIMNEHGYWVELKR